MAYTHTALITGGTSGLGYQASLAIARKHPDYLVVIASRRNTDDASESINRAVGKNNTVFLPLDLSSRAKTREFATLYKSKNFPPIKALLLNAGLQFPDSIGFTEDNVERTFAINHVNHALLFHLLFDQLADTARIVVTSSGTHDPAQNSGLPDAVYTKAEHLAQPIEPVLSKPGTQHYSNSKMANVMWTYALHRRLESIKDKRKLTVVAFDPGLMPGTGLAREYSAFLRWIWTHVFPRITPLLRLVFHTNNVHTTEESGKSLARLAIATDVEGISGVYYEGNKQIRSSVTSYEKDKQEDLWEWTLRNICQNDNERETFRLVNNGSWSASKINEES